MVTFITLQSQCKKNVEYIDIYLSSQKNPLYCYKWSEIFTIQNKTDITDTCCCHHYHDDIVIIIIAGVDTDVTAKGLTALCFACAGGHLESAKLLHQYGARVDLGDYKPLFLACLRGHMEVVQWLLDKG